ncbi:DUF3857 domain-containing protein [Chitinophaga rhizophila]|uniref:DUF3857 domain-containing protein n=1 Tax=Chitinophaga rhizophila TaxID=2866212 RepID=A0ABS7GGP2_9BACT|nr:DUF3857 domain-containing protein [Chitinophaga rhizophila]MBW8686862.1 DUF3857 domain-containing protein [Chitinophaga rhizophila]
MFSLLQKQYSAAIAVFISSLLAAMPALAGDPIYPALTIADSLQTYAHVVKRMEEVTVRIVDPKDVRVTRHYVMTVLDAEGERYARMIQGYDKLTEIRSIRGALYDMLGTQIKKLKQSDIEDFSGTGAESLTTDDRIKRHAFFHNTYPHTVEYEVEIRYNHTFYLPDWIPQYDESIAVEQSKLVVVAPKDYALRYHATHYSGNPVTSDDGSNRTYTWEIKNRCAAANEPYATRWTSRTTAVLLGPSVIEMQQYKGNGNTWEEYGRFMYTLNQGRDVLPDNVKQTVHQLTDGLTREEKITKLYHYLQQHTRYISIQLGIGGWQTFDAGYVAAKGYGDCKALSNYMCALLKEAGIRSACALVYAGDNNNDVTRADFPSSRFNHVIVCVPGGKDTTWLECTSNTAPVGYLGEFTADRSVLMYNEEGGKLIRTPAYTLEQNQQVRTIDAKVEESGDMTLQAVTRYTGLQQDDLHSRVNQLTKDKIIEKLKQAGLFASYDVQRYDWKEQKSLLPFIDEQIGISARNYATVTGKRMFIEPNLLNKRAGRLSSDSSRQSDIYLHYSYRDIDSVKITIPDGYSAETMPQPVTLQSPFGRYTSSTVLEGNTIIYIRSIDHRGGMYPAGSYEELVKFYNSMYKADRSRIVLVKK